MDGSPLNLWLPGNCGVANSVLQWLQEAVEDKTQAAEQISGVKDLFHGLGAGDQRALQSISRIEAGS